MKTFLCCVVFLIAVSISGCGGGGSSSQESQTSEAQSVASAKADLTFETIRFENQQASYITSDLYLPLTGSDATSISWTSSDTTVIANDGTVTRPDKARGDVDVTLTATITRGMVGDSKIFVLTVIALPFTDEEAVSAARSQLVFDVIRAANLEERQISGDLDLITHGINGTVLTWISSRPDIIAADGRVTRPNFTAGSVDVVLTATISRSTTSDTKQFILTVLALSSTDAQAVALAKAALTFDAIKALNTAENQITDNLNLTLDGIEATAIFWTSSNTDFIAADGRVTRPNFTAGNVDVVLTATISRNTASDTKQFVLTLLALPANDAEAVASAKAALAFEAIKGPNMAESQITDNLNLLTNWINDTTLTWLSSDSRVVSAAGNVTRPLKDYGNVDITLTATISRGDAFDTRIFDVTVLELPTATEFDYAGSGFGIHHVDTPQTDAGDSQIRYSLYLDDAVKDVYFVFTNASLNDAAAPPLVTDVDETTPELDLAAAATEAEEMATWARENGVGLSGRPDVSLFNSNPEYYADLNFGGPQVPDLPIASGPPEVLNDQSGDGDIFYPQNDTNTTIAATCRKVVSADGKTLNIWVADESWNGPPDCNQAFCVTQAMVDSLADTFLREGADNDIHEWVSTIFGQEWGTHDTVNLIAPDNNITILLYDIDGDNSTYGGVLGYFHAKDNYLQSYITGSNQRLMFYMDSVLFATPVGQTWEMQDYWPRAMTGTLAHEYQHMIQFYQKNILNALPGVETWLTEMCSMVAEDFVATKLEINGPRGVSYLDGTAGSSGNLSGRLPRFNRFNYLPVSQWMAGPINDAGDNNVLNSYSTSYAFGAFLARNYGGAAFFQHLVQNDKYDYMAISDALAASGYVDEDFDSVLQKWGAAVLLSDNAGSNVPEGYRLNADDFVYTTMGHITYELGSINLFNYQYESRTGPGIYTNLPPTDAMAGKYKTSNMYYRLGSMLTGTIIRDITLRKGTKLTVVVK